MREIGGWLQLVVLAGFLFPFLVVSCNGQTLVQAEGWRLAFGVSVELDEELSAIVEEGAEVDQSGAFWVTFALLSTIAAFGLTYSKLASKIVAVLSGLVPVALVAFWLRATADMKSTNVLGLAVSPGVGFWWVIVVSLVATGLFVWVDYGDDITDRVRGSPTPATGDMFCTQCGKPFTSGDLFCASCGTPVHH